MKLSERQHKFSRIMNRLLTFIFKNGCEVSFEGFTRPSVKLNFPGSDKELTYQEILYYNHKSKVKYGKHNMKLAGDLTIWKNGKILNKEEYRKFGVYWEALGGRWGGRFGIKKKNYNKIVGWDANHFECK